MTKVVVPYNHQERDTQIIHLAVTMRDRPAENEWRPAFRDVIDNQRVVWARFSEPSGAVWLRDREGVRRIRPAESANNSPQSPFKRTIQPNA